MRQNALGPNKKGEEIMSKLRHAIFCCFVTTLTVLCPLSARADQSFQRFLPLFVDLDGWQGKKPDGMSLDMPSSSMTTATRDYARGGAQAHASIMMGQAASGALAPIESGMNADWRWSHGDVDHA
jgi:hypothetical protein